MTDDINLFVEAMSDKVPLPVPISTLVSDVNIKHQND